MYSTSLLAIPTEWHKDYDDIPILKWSRLDKEVLRGNNAAWLEKCCALSGLNLKAPSSLCCSDGWLGLGGNGGGGRPSPVASSGVEEKGLSNWKTLVAQWRSGEEEDGVKAMEPHGALKGGLVNRPWRKRDGLALVWDREDEEESVTMSLKASSDDFCSREISELEKLSCLQLWKKMKTLFC